MFNIHEGTAGYHVEMGRVAVAWIEEKNKGGKEKRIKERVDSDMHWVSEAPLIYPMHTLTHIGSKPGPGTGVD